jgi:hypothetical protein
MNFHAARLAGKTPHSSIHNGLEQYSFSQFASPGLNNHSPKEMKIMTQAPQSFKNKCKAKNVNSIYSAQPTKTIPDDTILTSLYAAGPISSIYLVWLPKEIPEELILQALVSRSH